VFTVRFMGLDKLPSSELGMLSSVFVFLDQRRTKWSKLISFEEIRICISDARKLLTKIDEQKSLLFVLAVSVV
jgi:hypothetical protein